jgi:hypothetical protein
MRADYRSQPSKIRFILRSTAESVSPNTRTSLPPGELISERLSARCRNTGVDRRFIVLSWPARSPAILLTGSAFKR